MGCAAYAWTPSPVARATAGKRAEMVGAESSTMAAVSTPSSAPSVGAIDSDELGQVLVTHAGLTVGLWEELGEPGTPPQAAARLDALLDSPEEAFRPGRLMTGVHDRAVGVTWARAGAEIVNCLKGLCPCPGSL